MGFFDDLKSFVTPTDPTMSDFVATLSDDDKAALAELLNPADKPETETDTPDTPETPESTTETTETETETTETETETPEAPVTTQRTRRPAAAPTRARVSTVEKQVESAIANKDHKEVLEWFNDAKPAITAQYNKENPVEVF